MMRNSIGLSPMRYPSGYSIPPEPSPPLIRPGSLMVYVTSALMAKLESSTGSVDGGWSESCAVTVAQSQVEPGEEEHRHDAAADQRPNAEARHRRLLSLGEPRCSPVRTVARHRGLYKSYPILLSISNVRLFPSDTARRPIHLALELLLPLKHGSASARQVCSRFPAMCSPGGPHVFTVQPESAQKCSLCGPMCSL